MLEEKEKQIVMTNMIFTAFICWGLLSIHLALIQVCFFKRGTI